MSKVVLTDKAKKFIDTNGVVFDEALRRMAHDGVQIAKMTVPFAQGDLFKSIENEKKGFVRYWIAVNKEYAMYQELGRRRDGTHVVRRYTTPSTGKHYLKNAVNELKKNALNYLKQAAQTVYNRV